MKRLRLATLWLDGCSGCHMSLLDMDERFLELMAMVDLVFSPLMDCKIFPEGVDLTCVEGAVATEEDERRLRTVRERTRLLVALGDCAVTGNVPAMRNPFSAGEMLRTVYLERRADQAQVPGADLPPLRDQALPLHRFVGVDLFLPGCPPPADLLFATLSRLAAGEPPAPGASSRFGA